MSHSKIAVDICLGKLGGMGNCKLRIGSVKPELVVCKTHFERIAGKYASDRGVPSQRRQKWNSFGPVCQISRIERARAFAWTRSDAGLRWSCNMRLAKRTGMTQARPTSGHILGQLQREYGFGDP
ncbi:hypothetical protein [Rhizobium sp. ZPR3]|uniref:Uncharacterized protein n=2 Tax=unclassified Rhizobium TaxID=2613769 RepID=A0AAU7SKQ1_9HYPH